MDLRLKSPSDWEHSARITQALQLLFVRSLGLRINKGLQKKMHELAAARTEQLTRTCKQMAPIRKHTYFGHGPSPLASANRRPNSWSLQLP